MPKFTIGVDMSVVDQPLTGVGRYALEMCKRLAESHDIDIYLYNVSTSYAYLFDNERIHIKSYKKSIFKNSKFYLSLVRLPKQDKVDIFWSPYPRLPLFLPSSVYKVVTIHDLVWRYYPRTMKLRSWLVNSIFIPLALRQSDVILSVSRSTQRDLARELHIASNKIEFIPNAGRVNKDCYDIPNIITNPYFLFVGTIEPRKNLTNLLLAYSRLKDEDKLKLVIVGDKGWGGIRLTNLISDLDLDRYVELKGYVSEPQLASLYANAQFLVMPSLYEGFGLPLVEAMSHGTPVLTANNSSMPEVAGNAGLLVDALDVESIADGLQEMITNNELRERLAGNAKLNASRFSWDESAKKLITVFEKAIDLRKDKLI
jgi:glycosyltransferase involved in cell wall biosynthesis